MRDPTTTEARRSRNEYVPSASPVTVHDFVVDDCVSLFAHPVVAPVHGPLWSTYIDVTCTVYPITFSVGSPSTYLSHDTSTCPALKCAETSPGVIAQALLNVSPRTTGASVALPPVTLPPHPARSITVSRVHTPLHRLFLCVQRMLGCSPATRCVRSQQASGSGEPLRRPRRTRGVRGTRSRGEGQGEALASHESTLAFGSVKRNYPSRRGGRSQDLGVLLYAGEALVKRRPRMARPDQAANYAAGVLVA